MCGHSQERPVIGCCDPWGVHLNMRQRLALMFKERASRLNMAARWLIRTLHLDTPLAWALLVMGACAWLTQGCGSTASQHHALNSIAATADPSYALAVEGCDEAEGVIVARPGTTYEQDVASIAEIRTACDRIFGAFEALRVAHALARSAVDGGGEALKDAAWASLMDAWRALQLIAPEVLR